MHRTSLQKIFLISFFAINFLNGSDRNSYFFDTASLSQVIILKREILSNTLNIELAKKEQFYVTSTDIIYPETGPVVPVIATRQRYNFTDETITNIKEGGLVFPYVGAMHMPGGLRSQIDIYLKNLII